MVTGQQEADLSELVSDEQEKAISADNDRWAERGKDVVHCA